MNTTSTRRKLYKQRKWSEKGWGSCPLLLPLQPPPTTKTVGQTFFFFTQPRVSQSPLQTDNSLFNFQFFFFLLQSKFAKVQIETIQCQKSARYFVSTLQIVAARNRASTTLFVIHQGTLIGQSVMMHQLTSDSAIIELITQPRLGKTFSCLIM